MKNTLYFGDCLEVMRRDIADQSVDLIYLDPPFNSKRLNNAFIGGAQWAAFDDTWRWSEAVHDWHELAANVDTAPVMEGLRRILGEGAMLAYLSYIGNRLVECRRALKPTGSIFLHCDPTASHYLKVLMDALMGQENFRNEIVWCYTGPGSPKMRQFNRKHDIILWYSRGTTWTFNGNDVRIPHRKLNTNRSGAMIADAMTPDKRDEYLKKGKIPETWWPDFSPVGRLKNERLGYPTQKPLALLDRIVRASSNEGDVVLDPFCGCGTTIYAAHAAGRRWIGIDVSVNACKIIERRLKSAFDGLWSDVEFIGMPKTLDDARMLAGLDKFRFERWAAALIDGMEPNVRQRGDKGIDGRGRLALRKGLFCDAVSQVKGGKTGAPDVRAFNGARLQAGADMGVFICFEDRVTQGMKDAAASAGMFMNAPAVQIYTVEDYFEGRAPAFPRPR